MVGLVVIEAEVEQWHARCLADAIAVVSDPSWCCMIGSGVHERIFLILVFLGERGGAEASSMRMRLRTAGGRTNRLGTFGTNKLGTARRARRH